MSVFLRERWVKQLEAAQTDTSWRAQVEVRVLRFLLTRYEGQQEEAPLAPFPIYEGQVPYGRARLPLSQRDQHKRLEHIAQIDSERPNETAAFLDLDGIAYKDVIRHQRSEAKRERARNRRERGYW